MTTKAPICILCERETGPGSWCQQCRAYVCWRHATPQVAKHTLNSHRFPTHRTSGHPIDYPGVCKVIKEGIS